MPEFQRIVSLVPSLTELLVELGLVDRMVGRTRFCIHPEEKVEKIPIVGGTKNPRLDTIKEAEPDLIVANREENRKEDIEALSRLFRVHLTDIATIEDAIIEIHELGSLLGTGRKANELIQRISTLLEQRPEVTPLRTAYLIWKDPWMTIGSDTYIHDVMNHWQLINIFGDRRRYPRTTMTQVKRLNPELLLLSSEPFPFKEKHIEEVQNEFPKTRVLPVEGEWFSWYGSRMVTAFRELNVWRKAID